MRLPSHPQAWSLSVSAVVVTTLLRPSEEMQLVSRAGQERLVWPGPGAATSHSHAVVITRYYLVDSELPVDAVVVGDVVAVVVVAVVVNVKAKIMLL